MTENARQLKKRLDLASKLFTGAVAISMMAFGIFLCSLGHWVAGITFVIGSGGFWYKAYCLVRHGLLTKKVS